MILKAPSIFFSVELGHYSRPFISQSLRMIPFALDANLTLLSKYQKAWTLLNPVRASSILSVEQSEDCAVLMKPLDNQSKTTASESRMTLETIISIGVLGWLAVGMVLMGLGIW